MNIGLERLLFIVETSGVINTAWEKFGEPLVLPWYAFGIGIIIGEGDR